MAPKHSNTDDSPTCSCPLDECDRDEEYGCEVCVHLDDDAPCPHDFHEHAVPALQQVMDMIEGEGFEPVVLATDGSEPFASMDLGDGFYLDLTAQVREVGQ